MQRHKVNVPPLNPGTFGDSAGDHSAKFLFSNNMAETSNLGRDEMLVAYMEKTDKLNDLILKLLQKINGQESS